jgi:hypothetical protein
MLRCSIASESDAKLTELPFSRRSERGLQLEKDGSRRGVGCLNCRGMASEVEQ